MEKVLENLKIVAGKVGIAAEQLTKKFLIWYRILMVGRLACIGGSIYGLVLLLQWARATVEGQLVWLIGLVVVGGIVGLAWVVPKTLASVFIPEIGVGLALWDKVKEDK